MRRLPFVLPEWTRVGWASDAAREVWEPRIQRITRAWFAIEKWAVTDGAKLSALQNVPPEALPSYVAEAASRGLLALPLCQTPEARAYSSSTPASGPLVYRVALTQPHLAADWPTAWAKHDDRAIGRLLGFPTCCCEFFQRTWVVDHRVDTTLAMVGDRDAEVPAVSLANILWRWVGVRLVSHLPCRFDCTESIATAEQLRQVGRDHGFTEEMDWAAQILGWPTEYTAWRGIAEIRTPILRVSTRTDATVEKLTVRYRGSGYPDEGGSGIDFPFQRRTTLVPLTALRSYRSAFDPRDNGFASETALAAAHAVVLAAAGAPADAVIDLGCGDGRLARAVAGTTGRAFGVEINPDRASRAKARLTNVIVGPIADVERWRDVSVGLTLVMPGRILELSADEGARVRTGLTGRTVVVYAYGDWLTKYGSLERLTKRAGLPWDPVDHRRGDGVEAARMAIGA